MNDTRTRLARCFELVFPELTREEVLRASLSSVPEWDSVAAISLLTLVEEEFQLEISPDEVEDLISFELIALFMENLVGTGNSAQTFAPNVTPHVQPEFALA